MSAKTMDKEPSDPSIAGCLLFIKNYSIKLTENLLPNSKRKNFSYFHTRNSPAFSYRLTNDQPVHRQRHIPHRHDQPPCQNETTDHAADNEVQREQGDPSTQGAAARHDPEAHPMEAKR